MMLTRAALRGAFVLALIPGLLVAADAPPKPDKVLSRPVPLAIAKVRLLMDAINAPAFQQVSQALGGRPTADQTWQGISDRGVLVAEGGNLLLLRPPKGKLAGTWLDRATDLRLRAVELSTAADQHDYPAARKALAGLAESCRHCHQTFHVPVRVTALAPQPIRFTNVTTKVPQVPLVPPVPQAPAPPPPPAVPQPPGPPPTAQ